MGKKQVLSGESRVCNEKGHALIHHDLRPTFCSIAAGAAGVDVFTAMRLSLHECGGGATAVHSDYVQLEHLRPGLEKITDAILKHAERPKRLDRNPASNVVALVPRRPASSNQSGRYKRSSWTHLVVH